MKSPKKINLNDLANELRDEVEQMLVGIRGDADGALWTATLRPATRGGKCMMIAVSIDE
jgi:hypothetical protein